MEKRKTIRRENTTIRTKVKETARGAHTISTNTAGGEGSKQLIRNTIDQKQHLIGLKLNIPESQPSGSQPAMACGGDVMLVCGCKRGDETVPVAQMCQ